MKTIWMVSEGNHIKGLGHIYRSLVLAEYLQRLSPVRWLLPSADRQAQELVLGSGFTVQNYVDSVHLYRILVEHQPGLYVFDLMHYAPRLLNRLQALPGPKVCLGLLPSQAEGIDITINAASGNPENRIWYRGQQTHFQGPRYVFLRPAFLSASWSPSAHPDFKRLLLLFGAADPADLTRRAMARLHSEAVGIQLTAILGAAYPVNRSLPDRLPTGWRVLYHVSNPVDEMLAADCILCSPGNVFFEALALKVPALALLQNQTQAQDFKDFAYVSALDAVCNLAESCQTLHQKYVDYRAYADDLAVGQGYPDILHEIQQRMV